MDGAPEDLAMCSKIDGAVATNSLKISIDEGPAGKLYFKHYYRMYRSGEDFNRIYFKVDGVTVFTSNENSPVFGEFSDAYIDGLDFGIGGHIFEWTAEGSSNYFVDDVTVVYPDRSGEQALLDSPNKILVTSEDGSGIEFKPFSFTDKEVALLELTDAPKSYIGHAGKTLSVKGTEDGIEFTRPIEAVYAGPIVEDFETIAKLERKGTWITTDQMPYSGSTCLRSAAIDHDQTSETEITFTTGLSDEFSFWYKVSTETDYDKFFAILNEEYIIGGISGDIPWTQYIQTLPAGNHTLKLIYTRDLADGGLLDACFVDLITIASVLSYNMVAVLQNPDKLLLTSADGSHVGFMDVPVIPVQATEEVLGLVKAKAKTTETSEIAIDPATGKLFVGIPEVEVTNEKDGTALKFWSGTEAEYQLIETPDTSTLYFSSVT